MIIPFGSNGLLAKFGNTAFSALLTKGGEANTDRSRIGSTPVTNKINSDPSIEDPGRIDNASQTASTELDSSIASGRTNFLDRNGVLVEAGGQGVGDGGSSAHANAQWLGKSLRSPMGNEGDAGSNTKSKNIFFRFSGTENAGVPGIWLWINPSQLVINHSKKIQEQVTRGGFVLFHWGDNLDEISSSGITGSFARLNCPGSNNGQGYTGSQPDIGLDRRDTWPYYRFMQLLALYRNNGISFSNQGTRPTGGFQNQDEVPASALSQQSLGASTNKTGTNNNSKNFVTSGLVNGEKNQRPAFSGIEMHYDDQVFTGYFNSLVWTERAEDPFKFNIDFKFTVLNTVYNRVFNNVSGTIKPTPPKVGENLLANFQIPRYNSI